MSLQRRWFLLLSLFFVLVISGLSLFFYQLNRDSMSKALIEKYKLFSNYVAQNLSEYMVLSNVANAERTVVSDLRTDPEILYFYYQNLDGQVMLQLDETQKLEDLIDPDFRHAFISENLNLRRIDSPRALFELRETSLQKDLVRNNQVIAEAGEKIYEIRQGCWYADQKLGTYRMGISLRNLDTALRGQLLKTTAIGLILILLGLVIIHYYSLRLLRPVHELTERLQTIINPRSDLKLEDQISQFNIEKIDDSTVELRSLKEAFLAFKRNLLSSISQVNKLNRVESMVLTVQMLAHDLRRPFSQLKMLLQNGTANEETLKKGFSQVQGSILQIDGMMNDLMDFTIENIALKPTALVDILRPAVEQAQGTLVGTSIRIELDIPENVIIWADSEKATRIFSNLVSNAVEAILEIGKSTEGYIKVSALKQDDLVTVKVYNSGPEIASDQIDKIFDLFFTQGKSKGTGLGLAIVQKLVQLHKGQISVRNFNGVEFIANFQADQSLNSPAWQQTLEPAKLEVSKKVSVLSGKTVLHLENEEIYRQGLKNLFEGYQDWNILDTEHFTDAQNLFKNNKIDLVIADIDLGLGPSGVDFAKWAYQTNPQVQIFFHTNRAPSEIPAMWRSRVIPKPMSPDTLAQIIN